MIGNHDLPRTLSRCAMLLFAAASCFFAMDLRGAVSQEDEVFLNMLEYRSCQFFLREMNPENGLVPDRAAAAADDARRFAACSVAGGGFGLSALCIADSRGWIAHTDAVARVRAALRFALNIAPKQHGFLYHFLERRTGSRRGGCEVSPIDTSLFLCGALAARQHFKDAEISSLAGEFYSRVDWPWMLNGGETLCLGWKPETGFSRHRWHGYAEHMAMYLLGIGSPTHPLPAECWHAWRREPVGSYAGKTFIMYPPLFVHQYAHAFVDFRGLSDDYCDYWQNSVFATLMQRQMCMDLRAKFPAYGENLWGITASSSAHGYHAWGGPQPTPDIDGTVVPCAAGGSIPFAPRECLDALRNMYSTFGDRVWCRYGFVDAFNPDNGWTSRDVLAIDAGITLVMAENFRTGLVWDRFMANPEVTRAMQMAGFRPAPKLAANTSLLDARQGNAPAAREEPRDAVASFFPLPEFQWDWHTVDAANSRQSVFDGDNKISARFAFGWSTTSLEVRAAITDPDIVPGDKFELYLDPENVGFRWGDYRDFLFSFSLTNQCAESLGRPLENPTVLATNDGYRVIASIPWKLLGVEPHPGLVIGCSPGVYSVSSAEEPAVKLNWHWRGLDDGAFRLGTLTLEGE